MPIGKGKSMFQKILEEELRHLHAVPRPAPKRITKVNNQPLGAEISLARKAAEGGRRHDVERRDAGGPLRRPGWEAMETMAKENPARVLTPAERAKEISRRRKRTMEADSQDGNPVVDTAGANWDPQLDKIGKRAEPGSLFSTEERTRFVNEGAEKAAKEEPSLWDSLVQGTTYASQQQKTGKKKKKGAAGGGSKKAVKKGPASGGSKKGGNASGWDWNRFFSDEGPSDDKKGGSARKAQGTKKPKAGGKKGSGGSQKKRGGGGKDGKKSEAKKDGWDWDRFFS